MKEEAATAIDQFQEAEAEAKALRSMTQRMVLTQEEMVCKVSIDRKISLLNVERIFPDYKFLK